MSNSTKAKRKAKTKAKTKAKAKTINKVNVSNIYCMYWYWLISMV